MKDKEFIKKLVSILITSMVAYFYTMSIVPLAYMYNDFPGQDSLTVLIASLPGLVAMFGAFAAAPLMRFVEKKWLIVASLFLALGGGLLVSYIGKKSLLLCIIGASVTGIAAGIIPSVNMAVLAEIAPENMRDKVCGWSESCCSAGMMLATFLSGILSADGNWARAFSVYYIVIPVLIVAVLLYPKHIGSGVNMVEDTSDEASVLPKSALAIIIMRFLFALFYLAVSYNVSELIINNLNGSSVLVGNGTTIVSLLMVIICLVVFAFIKIFKGFTPVFAQVLAGIGMIIMAKFCTTGPAVIAIWCVTGVGIACQSSMVTFCTMASKGKAIGLATSLYTGATFVGEFLCAYTVPMLSGVLFGEVSPSNNILAGGIACIVLGVISIPACVSVYKLAFPANKSETKE